MAEIPTPSKPNISKQDAANLDPSKGKPEQPDDVDVKTAAKNRDCFFKNS